MRNFISSSYVSLDKGKIVNIYVPRDVIEEDDKAILVKNVAKNWASLKAIVDLLNYLKAREIEVKEKRIVLELKERQVKIILLK